MLRRRPKTVALQFLRSLGNKTPDVAIAMLADDVTYTDGRGWMIEGRRDCASALDRFFALGMQFDVEIRSVSQIGPNVLVSGDTKSAFPGMSAHHLWRIQTHMGKVCEYQTHRKDNPPAMARILMGKGLPAFAAA